MNRSHLAMLLLWQANQYQKFADISASRQKIVLGLVSAGLLETEPFLSVTQKGLQLLQSVESFFIYELERL